MAAQVQALIAQAPGALRDFRDFQQTRLSALRPPQEFFDVQRVSRPQDLNEATRRISHNTRYFGGNYSLVVALLAVYALLTNPLLLIAIGFLSGGFIAINKFAPEPSATGESGPVTQKSLYTGLFVIGIPLLWLAAPLSTIFWIVGASSVLILGHASMLEPGVESEYGSVETV
ncbi:prenylated rab acceptor PRA1 [Cystobasidium minutum MCA 4210]|uniref:prenylated rab acceptor PRA1 n=1 Tax=Cystobasidium minutum MCA 4210 TaxID=1397322 RepID=UPI0034CE90A6|eukprot:jgi/Rhomi1/47421/CE47420_1501